MIEVIGADGKPDTRTEPTHPATVTNQVMSGIAMQVCVPKHFTDEQATQFAEDHKGMIPRIFGLKMELRKGHSEDPDRAQCSDHAGNCHIVFIMENPEGEDDGRANDSK